MEDRWGSDEINGERSSNDGRNVVIFTNTEKQCENCNDF